MWATIVAVIKIIGVILSMIFKRNKEINEKKKEALKEVVSGIKEKDPSKITRGFDRLHRI